jgi:hypothetical protein
MRRTPVADISTVRTVLALIDASKNPFDGYDDGVAHGDKKAGHRAYETRQAAIDHCIESGLIAAPTLGRRMGSLTDQGRILLEGRA